MDILSTWKDGWRDSFVGAYTIDALAFMMAFLISRDFYLIGNTNTLGNLTLRIVHVRNSTSAVSLDLQRPWFSICITVSH
jgi:hypothetical protein